MSFSLEEEKAKIDNMTHYDCMRLWRFGASELPVFQNKELFDYFMARFNNLGGFTPGISKAVGW